MLPTRFDEFPLEHHLQFIFDEATMDLIKKNDSGSFKTFCSGILDNTWYIAMYPNGKDESQNGQLSIYFGFVKYPRNIRSISVDYKMYDMEKHLLDCNDSYEFRPVGNAHSVGHYNMCSSEVLKEFRTLTIKVDIKVTNIKRYDNYDLTNPFTINNPVKIAYLLSSPNP